MQSCEDGSIEYGNAARGGKDIVDIAFYPEDVFGLSELALQNDVRVISDMGVAPGMSNLLEGYAANKLDKVHKADIYVGGLPKIRTKPWEYKAVFSDPDGNEFNLIESK